MLFQRAFTLLVLLLGIGLRLLLPRPWAEVGEAEAAKPKRLRCVGYGVRLHNPTTADVTVPAEILDPNGNALDTLSVPIPAGGTRGFNHGEAGAVLVTPPKDLVVFGTDPSFGFSECRPSR